MRRSKGLLLILMLIAPIVYAAPRPVGNQGWTIQDDGRLLAPDRITYYTQTNGEYRFTSNTPGVGNWIAIAYQGQLVAVNEGFTKMYQFGPNAGERPLPSQITRELTQQRAGLTSAVTGIIGTGGAAPPGTGGAPTGTPSPGGPPTTPAAPAPTPVRPRSQSPPFTQTAASGTMTTDDFNAIKAAAQDSNKVIYYDQAAGRIAVGTASEGLQADANGNLFLPQTVDLLGRPTPTLDAQGRPIIADGDTVKGRILPAQVISVIASGTQPPNIDINRETGNIRISVDSSVSPSTQSGLVKFFTGPQSYTETRSVVELNGKSGDTARTFTVDEETTQRMCGVQCTGKEQSTVVGRTGRRTEYTTATIEGRPTTYASQIKDAVYREEIVVDAGVFNRDVPRPVGPLQGYFVTRQEVHAYDPDFGWDGTGVRKMGVEYQNAQGQTQYGINGETGEFFRVDEAGQKIPVDDYGGGVEGISDDMVDKLSKRALQSGALEYENYLEVQFQHQKGQGVGKWMNEYNALGGIRSLSSMFMGDYAAKNRAKLQQEFALAAGLENLAVSAICGQIHELKADSVLAGRGPTGRLETSASLNAERSLPIELVDLDRQALLDILGNTTSIAGVTVDLTNERFDPKVLGNLTLRMYHVHYSIQNNAQGDDVLRYNLEFRRTGQPVATVAQSVVSATVEDYEGNYEEYLQNLRLSSLRKPALNSRWFPQDKTLEPRKTATEHKRKYSTNEYDQVCLVFNPGLPSGSALDSKFVREFCRPFVEYAGGPTSAEALAPKGNATVAQANPPPDKKASVEGGGV